jgi:transcriptional regulator with XRE-family HTH domain
MASLSERLKRERELRGISLKQISEETRIGVRFLQALEDDRLDIIPGEFYRRSYLRAYARYLGLDEDLALNVYDFSRKDNPSEGEAEARSGDAVGFPALPRLGESGKLPPARMSSLSSLSSVSRMSSKGRQSPRSSVRPLLSPPSPRPWRERSNWFFRARSRAGSRSRPMGR